MPRPRVGSDQKPPDTTRMNLSRPTVLKAKRLLRHHRVCLDVRSESFFEFKIYGTVSNYEVYIRIDRHGIMHFSCNSDNNGYSCVFSNKDRSKPYCSHTLAAYLFLRREGIIAYDEDEFLEWQDRGERLGYEHPKTLEVWKKQNPDARRQMIKRAQLTWRNH